MTNLRKFAVGFVLGLIVSLSFGTYAVIKNGACVPGLCTASSVAITGGTIDGAVIGGTTPAAGTFTPLTVGASGSQAILQGDAANTLAQRNSTNAQEFRVYNTFTDASNNEYFRASWAANVVTLSTVANGTGTARALNVGTEGVATLNFRQGGSNRWQINTSANLVAVTDNSVDIGASGATRPRNLYLASSIKQVGGITTSSTTGVSAVVANGRATAQSGANASVSTFTVGAADGSFEVSANVLVTTATTHAFTVTCAYTDEGNTARTLTMPFTLVAGSAIVTSVANANGAVPYMGIVQHIRAKAATAITIATTGTFTTVAYNVEGIIKQTN